MTEKVVRSLQDLEEALATAAQQGVCRIRVGTQVAALIPSTDPGDVEAERFLSHPVVANRLSQAARSLAEGRGVAHDDVRRRYGSKKV